MKTSDGELMEPRPRARFRIGQVMFWIAAVACILALPRLIRSPRDDLFPILLAALAAVPLFFRLVDYALIGVFGTTCPICGRLTLHRIARHRHYYRCSSCRARLYRLGRGPWLDASDHQEAVKFKKATEAGNWTAFKPSETLDGSTSGRLLGTKRSTDLTRVARDRPLQFDPARELEKAERKVRRFLKHRDDEEVY